MNNLCDTLLRETSQVLEDNILRYWLTLLDDRGGCRGDVLADGSFLPDAPRGAVLQSRIVWAFSAAARAMGRDDYRAAALRAGAYFRAHFIDPVSGGVFWSLDASGAPLDTKKQLYAQGFGIYGLSELYRLTGDASVLSDAVALFRVVETHFADRENGGYIEALSREFAPLSDMSLSAHDINADKTMNSHLHILEAYANLYAVWPDEALRVALHDLIEILGTRILGPDGHLRLYFRRDWTVLPGAVSYGHDIETSWLLLEAAQALGDAPLSARVMGWADALGRAGNEGLLPDGSMMYETHPDGTQDLSRQWWVQAEAVVGNLWRARYHGDPAGLARAWTCWSYIRDHLLRPEGEWYWSILPSASPGTPGTPASPDNPASPASRPSTSSCALSTSSGSPGTPPCAPSTSSDAPSPASPDTSFGPDTSSGAPSTPDLTQPIAGFWKCPYHNTRMCLQVESLVGGREV